MSSAMPDARRPEIRRAFQLTIAAFAGTLIGILGMTLLSLRDFRGLADRSLFIAEHDAAAVAQVSTIRGVTLTARSAARDAADAPPEARQGPRDQSLASLVAIRKLLSEHEALHADEPADHGTLIRGWSSFEEKLLRILEAVDRNDPARARTLMDESRDDYLHFAGVLQADVARHNTDAHLHAIGINAGLRQFSSGIAVLTAIGVFCALVLLVLAIRSLRLAVAALAAEKEAAEARATELDAFAARVAHDLRGPLTAIKVTLSGVARRADEATSASLKRANGSIDTLNRMIEEMLEFARQGGVPLQPGACEPSSVAQAVLQEMTFRIETDRILLNTRLNATRAAIGEAQFRMIVSNLLDNAIKYMGDGPVRTVEVSTESSGGHVLLVVKDSGQGIAPDVLPSVFLPFVRGTTESGGYGVGLSTVKRLVEAHGGQVTLESRVGQGTTATVTLPAIPPL